MIRIVCVEVDAGVAANIGGPVATRYKSFDVELPEIEVWLNEKPMYCERSFAGIEVRAEKVTT